jgi:hypothetical protein
LGFGDLSLTPAAQIREDSAQKATSIGGWTATAWSCGKPHSNGSSIQLQAVPHSRKPNVRSLECKQGHPANLDLAILSRSVEQEVARAAIHPFTDDADFSKFLRIEFIVHPEEPVGVALNLRIITYG